MHRTLTPDRLGRVCDALRSGNDLAATRDWGIDLLWRTRRGAVDLPFPAVRHPLGFLCLPLHRSHPSGLCLHIWPGRADGSGREAGGTIHAHSWTMTSLVLVGEVVNERIDVRADGCPTHQILRVSRVGKIDALVPTGRRVAARIAARERLAESGRCTLAAGEFHRTTLPVAHRPVTLVLGEHRPRIRDYVLSGLRAKGHMAVRRACRSDDFRTAAAAALPALP